MLGSDSSFNSMEIAKDGSPLDGSPSHRCLKWGFLFWGHLSEALRSRMAASRRNAYQTNDHPPKTHRSVLDPSFMFAFPSHKSAQIRSTAGMTYAVSLGRWTNSSL